MNNDKSKIDKLINELRTAIDKIVEEIESGK